jgi:hypothetical protein
VQPAVRSARTTCHRAMEPLLVPSPVDFDALAHQVARLLPPGLQRLQLLGRRPRLRKLPALHARQQGLQRQPHVPALVHRPHAVQLAQQELFDKVALLLRVQHQRGLHLLQGLRRVVRWQRVSGGKAAGGTHQLDVAAREAINAPGVLLLHVLVLVQPHPIRGLVLILERVDRRHLGPRVHLLQAFGVPPAIAPPSPLLAAAVLGKQLGHQRVRLLGEQPGGRDVPREALVRVRGHELLVPRRHGGLVAVVAHPLIRLLLLDGLELVAELGDVLPARLPRRLQQLVLHLARRDVVSGPGRGHHHQCLFQVAQKLLPMHRGLLPGLEILARLEFHLSAPARV